MFRVARFVLVQHTKTGKTIQNDDKMYQIKYEIKNIPFGHKIDQLANKKPTSYLARPSKIYPNWEFWFHNIPSGSTGEVDFLT
jgi:hypothetical protein